MLKITSNIISEPGLYQLFESHDRRMILILKLDLEMNPQINLNQMIEVILEQSNRG